MPNQSTLPTPPDAPETVTQVKPASPRHRMSARNRLLFFLVAWLIVLMPFLFWWSTWFGRHLSDPQITEYLTDDKHPRPIHPALVQLAGRKAHPATCATRS